MKSKILVILGLTLGLTLAGCTQNSTGSQDASEAKPSIGPERQETKNGQAGTAQTETAAEGPVFSGRQLSAEDAALLDMVREAAGAAVLLFDAADYDGNGAREAFAFAGTDDDGVLEGQRWFVSKDGAQRLETAAGNAEYLQNRSAVVTTQEGNAFWYTESDGASETCSWLWGVLGGEPAESVLSGKGQDFTKEEDGGFLLYRSGLDACTDGTGRTVNPGYFYFKDGAFYEYGAQAIGREAFLSIPGASDCIASYENDNYWIQDIWLRGNGLVQVNLRNVEQNKNLTCVWKDGRLVTEAENDGIAGLVVGELASKEWSGPESVLSALWEESCAAEEEDGMFVRIRPDTAAWYDLDGDGQPEEIRYTVLRGEDEYLAEGTRISIDRKTVFETDNTVSSDYRLWVTDLDRADGKRELLLQGQEENDIFTMQKFLRLENGTLAEVCDLKEAPVWEGEGSLYRIGLWDFDSGRLMRIPGDGTVSLWADTPVYTQGLGCYYTKLSYDLKGAQIKAAEQEEYEMKTYAMDGQPPYAYTARIAVLFYESPQKHPEGVPVFTAEPGEQLNCLALAPATENMIYAKMKRVSTGEIGWTLFSETMLFEETPAWG